MTDKEIIIDGVNVSRCKFFNDITESYYCFGIPCKDRPNCYFKQLQRSVVRIKDLEERIMGHSKTVEEYCDRLARKTQECEDLSNKIKNEIQNTVEMERLAKSYGQDLMIYKQNKDIEVNSLKGDVIFYLKLIKKIEIYCDEQNLKYDTTACEILDIIHKAKGGRMRITIGTPERQIPHIIHGISANTLFYLINYEKYILNRAYDSNNYTGIDIPHDVDDFSRIDNAYTCFGWNEKDIEKAKETAKELNLPRKFENFLDRFYEFKDYYEDNNYDEFYALYLTILEEE